MTNFGDEMSPLAWEVATGRKPLWASPDRADAIAIGSILELAARRRNRADPLIVWGSGARSSAPDECSKMRDWDIRAVRGPKTVRALKLSPSTQIGDPGLLASQLGVAALRIEKRITFIPHFATWSTAEGRALLLAARSLGAQVIAPTLTPKRIATEILASQIVVTSSLHAVIFSHALGRPVVPIVPPKSEPRFKYEDHYAAMNASLTFRTLAEAFSLAKSANSSVPEFEDISVIAQRAHSVGESLAKAIAA